MEASSKVFAGCVKNNYACPILLPTAANQTAQQNKNSKLKNNLFKQFAADFYSKKWVATYSH